MTRQDEIDRVHGNGTHVVILGVGASIAFTIKNPEKNGNQLPTMNNITQILELGEIVEALSKELQNLSEDFEKFYSKLVLQDKYLEQRQ